MRKFVCALCLLTSSSFAELPGGPTLEVAPPRDEGYPTAPPYHEGDTTAPTAPPPRASKPAAAPAAPVVEGGGLSYEKSNIEYRLARCYSDTDGSSLVIQFNALKRNGRWYSKAQRNGGRSPAISIEAETSATETFFPEAHNTWGSEISWVLLSDNGYLLRLSGSQLAPYGAVMGGTAWLYPPSSGQYVAYGCTVMGMSRLSHIFESDE